MSWSPRRSSTAALGNSAKEFGNDLLEHGVTHFGGSVAGRRNDLAADPLRHQRRDDVPESVAECDYARFYGLVDGTEQ